MGKTPEGRNRRPAQSSQGALVGGNAADLRRMDQLAQAVDHCLEAKRIAEMNGEKLLVYLLAMAIQETRGAMRNEVASRAALEPVLER